MLRLCFVYNVMWGLVFTCSDDVKSEIKENTMINLSKDFNETLSKLRERKGGCGSLILGPI